MSGVWAGTKLISSVGHPKSITMELHLSSDPRKTPGKAPAAAWGGEAAAWGGDEESDLCGKMLPENEIRSS